ncbi:nitrite reductase large subunit NirB [Neptunomonas antarctica]|uniref:Assimilatory nitrite reductase (NAD(P)H) large subunit n=1 Tax=Neptunomonas antarctica TaxID=619304 RepID=A0A1N7L363_9GAMM|nr:nitrite reductase large subunit NirB [Neptunomonas antarctica]SIS68292.1 assimilatory nitrite reductase (NAD(P)H) large subunit precursor [Neptunomonas antarctica]
MNKQNLVVVGNGMVGHQFLQSLADSGQLNQFNVTVFCEEPRLAYDRVYLSSYFSGATAEDLAMGHIEVYQSWGLNVLIGEAVTSIDRDAQHVFTNKGTTLFYDKLVLATGSYPFVPPVPGHDRQHCLVYRTIEDLEAIKASANGAKVGVVVGGGLLGLEAAKAIKDLGLETHVVEFAPRLMAVQLDEGGGNLLRRKIENLGVRVHTGKNTQQIVDGDDAFHRMEFADGEVLETDLILFSAGIRPRDNLARDCGLEVGERGGIVVDNNCQTSDEHIYSIGECALWSGRIYGLVAPGYAMAKVVVAQLTGGDKQFLGADMSTKLKLMGIDVASIGDAHGHIKGSLSYTYNDEVNEVYKKIVVSESGNELLGAILVGEANDYGTLLQYALNGIQLPSNPETLIVPNFGGDDAQTGLGVGALPETAQICSCHDVTKGGICCSIDAGAQTVGDVKAGTKAATGCGGCTQLLTDLVNYELELRGVEVSHDICEHFAYTREDLYNIIRIEEIKTFSSLLATHGHGHGCEICKPLIGSLLSSCWNEYILDTPHVGLQDTNDTFMANMQKDGTYSVVPRVPAGEITPDQLIAIGQVGKKYDLYTKVTGGQRIDLFGARLEQLPDIWKELIDAGMETGHAYGKSLRTVKSCVGSTWCRYGVEDSTGLAIELENRYKGLRAPHKIKFGVSGCTRECAEAQSKDVGIIATENGWNLYLCGNGGMKPRHGDLFATDLDKDTLVKYVDRFLMFYIKTGKRLQRTSVWMENLEGGLDYLRKVVIDDHLGMNKTLESQMEHVVATYECEWKRTIEDEDSLKRFRTFVNSEKTDNNIVFIQERGQIRPATEEEKTIAEPIKMLV